MWKDISKNHTLKNQNASSFIWVFEAEKVSISLVNMHHEYKGDWDITCFINNNFFLRTKINIPTLEHAQNYALSYVKNELAGIIESLPGI